MKRSTSFRFPSLPKDPPAGLEPLVERLLRRLPAQARGVLGLVSGGPDSTALALALHYAQREAAWGRVELVHFDHRLRPESGEEARLVEALGEWLGLPTRVVPLAVREHARLSGLGLEAAGRHLRLGWLKQNLGEMEVAADAHHREDQVESVALQILRGAGPLGARGIHPCLGGVLFRPFLDLGRDRLREPVEGLGVPTLTDPSNLDPAFLRNRLRWGVLRGEGELADRLLALGERSRRLFPLALGWLGGVEGLGVPLPAGERGLLEEALARRLGLVRVAAGARDLWRETVGEEMGARLFVYLVLRREGIIPRRGELWAAARALVGGGAFADGRLIALSRPGALVVGRPLPTGREALPLAVWEKRFGVRVEVEGVGTRELRVLNRAAWRGDSLVGHLYRKKLLQAVAPRELRGVWPILVWPSQRACRVLGTGRWLGMAGGKGPQVRLSLLQQGENQAGQVGIVDEQLDELG